MHPSSSGHRPASTPLGLTRYDSAPGSFLSALSDSIITNTNFSAAAAGSPLPPAGRSRFFSGDSPSLTSESSCKVADLDRSYNTRPKHGGDVSTLEIGLDRHYYGPLDGFSVVNLPTGSGVRGGGDGPSSLFRHSSSPAGFLSHLVAENGFSIGRSRGGYSLAGVEGMGINKRLKPQVSFSSRQDSISHISGTMVPDVGECSVVAHSADEATGHTGQSFITSNFQIGPWEESGATIFSSTIGKHRRDENGDSIIAILGNIDSQYGLPKTALEMANVEHLFQIQEDTVPCKVRAKRGCATHPRSIAERERRTRISDKLRKLQELVPNMDKQTSTSDMLDLAVEHIRSLQSQVQKLKQEDANCKCTRKHVVS